MFLMGCSGKAPNHTQEIRRVPPVSAHKLGGRGRGHLPPNGAGLRIRITRDLVVIGLVDRLLIRTISLYIGYGGEKTVIMVALRAT
jgi:hypothetical protein